MYYKLFIVPNEEKGFEFSNENNEIGFQILDNTIVLLDK